MKLYSKIFQKNILKPSQSSNFVESLNGLQVTILSTRVYFHDEHEKIKFTSELDLQDEDEFTKTYLGQFGDGTKFRLIQPQKLSLAQIKQEYDCEGAFSIASTDPQGFAIHFLLVKSSGIEVKIEEKGNRDQVYKLIDATVMAYQSGLYTQSVEFIKRIVELDPGWKITATHSKARDISDIIDFLKK